MPFTRPTLSELVTRIDADFVSRMEFDGQPLRRAVVRIVARVLAGAAHGLYGFLAFIFRQMFVDTAEAEYLRRRARVYGLTPNAAAFAAGNVVATGVNGSTIPAGTVLTRADGQTYATGADGTISAGTAIVAATAVLAGELGNCDAGVLLSFESPVTGVDTQATVDTGGLGSGTDEETDAEFRIRVLERTSNPPHGGNATDYPAWAKEVAGVTRAWVYPAELGAGTVVVRFVRDDDVDLIPDSGEVADVQAHIDAVRPVTAIVTVLAPTTSTVNYTFSSLTPNTVEVQAAITAELTDLHLRVAEPGVTLRLSAIRTAVGTAAGVTDYVLSSPSADVTVSTGQLPKKGTVTFP